MRCRSTSLMGTTSACAENTCRNPQNAFLDWNYLRVRGEYSSGASWPQAKSELPPRARRILFRLARQGGARGTTSACAENTQGEPTSIRAIGNYLRVRGEYVGRHCAGLPRWELPPRARRIPNPTPPPKPRQGTTSACAENTRRLRFQPGGDGNYLRVRGEYARRSTSFLSKMELPPRARRILALNWVNNDLHGTTSACAENTLPAFRFPQDHGNYLRVRGEYRRCPLAGWGGLELPPRARRILPW